MLKPRGENDAVLPLRFHQTLEILFASSKSMNVYPYPHIMSILGRILLAHRDMNLFYALFCDKSREVSAVPQESETGYFPE